jgi:hypothetical protein
MSHRLVVSVVVALAVAGPLLSCSHGDRGGHLHPPGTTTTTRSGPIPVDGWAVAGTTQIQSCDGARHQNDPACSPPVPASLPVTVSRGDVVVGQATSGTDGRFRIPVPPGSYTVQAISDGVFTHCFPVSVEVAGPPVPTEVTLTCVHEREG